MPEIKLAPCESVFRLVSKKCLKNANNFNHCNLKWWNVLEMCRIRKLDGNLSKNLVRKWQKENLEIMYIEWCTLCVVWLNHDRLLIVYNRVERKMCFVFLVSDEINLAPWKLNFRRNESHDHSNIQNTTYIIRSHCEIHIQLVSTLICFLVYTHAHA